MAAVGAREMIARELQQAVERLHRDMERVEYEASGSRLNEFILPQRTGETERNAISDPPEK